MPVTQTLFQVVLLLCHCQITMSIQLKRIFLSHSNVMLPNSTGSTNLVQIPHQGKMTSCKSVERFVFSVVCNCTILRSNFHFAPGVTKILKFVFII